MRDKDIGSGFSIISGFGLIGVEPSASVSRDHNTHTCIGTCTLEEIT
jgi:hypothetical protein